MLVCHRQVTRYTNRLMLPLLYQPEANYDNIQLPYLSLRFFNLKNLLSLFATPIDNLYQDQDIPCLDSEDELDAGQIYFILPKTMLARRLSASDMASLAVKASLALDSNSNSNSHVKKKNNNKARISPMVLMETSQINVVVEEEEIKNYKNGGLRVSRSGSIRKLPRSKRARLAARSFRLKLSTIYENAEGCDN